MCAKAFVVWLPMFAGLSGCAATPGPCLQWLEPGDTYEVTLGRSDPIPFDKSAVELRSCGAKFDLREGDSFVLATAQPKSPAPACDMIKATTDSQIRNVMLGHPAALPGSVQVPHVEAGFPDAIIGKACRGKYRVGLNETGILRAYRALQADTVEQCIAEGAELTDEIFVCWDSWRVEVKDSQGNVVATSLD